MIEYKFLDTSAQIELFESRGVIFKDKSLAEKKLNFINYYKLKELSYPYMVITEYGWKYEKLEFDELIKRYYQDKKIRLELMDCTEKIEIALKTLFSHELGKDLGPYGYLKFKNWCNKDEYCKHYLKEKQSDFKNRIDQIMQNSKMRTKCINQHIKINYGLENGTDKVPIWMLVEVLTFGDIIWLLGLMSNKRLSRIANRFKCENTDEFISWMKTTNFIRNQCAHNTSIIDLKLKTKPKLKKEWKDYLSIDESGNPTGRLSDAILPIVYLVIVINEKYTFNKLQGAINRLISKNDLNAIKLGFKSYEESKNFIELLGGKFQIKKNNENTNNKRKK